MLPYSPLHHLLLADSGETLVMTSGNVSDEPIAYRDEDALERLRGIADLFLVHDRPIQTRTDDSVLRVVDAPDRPRPAFLRRSRGYVPAALTLPGTGTPRPLLACGAELKNTFCLAKGTRAWVSHHIGDLENYETLRSFAEGIEHFGRLFAVEPEVVAHDLHPEYLSTKYALERDGVELVGGPAPSRPSRGVPGRARRDRTGGRRDLRRHRLRARRYRVGRRAAARRPAVVPAGRVAVAGGASRRGARDPTAVADGVRVAGGGRRGRAGVAAIAGGERRSARVVAGVPADRDRHGRAGDDEHGAPVRRGRRARRNPARGQLRGPGGDRTRGRV